jgi:hypothetical protein
MRCRGAKGTRERARTRLLAAKRKVRSESAMGREPFLFFWFGLKCTVTVLN